LPSFSVAAERTVTVDVTEFALRAEFSIARLPPFLGKMPA